MSQKKVPFLGAAPGGTASSFGEVLNNLKNNTSVLLQKNAMIGTSRDHCRQPLSGKLMVYPARVFSPQNHKTATTHNFFDNEVTATSNQRNLIPVSSQKSSLNHSRKFLQVLDDTDRSLQPNTHFKFNHHHHQAKQPTTTTSPVSNPAVANTNYHHPSKAAKGTVRRGRKGPEGVR